jgi:four helix bundle protein
MDILEEPSVPYKFESLDIWKESLDLSEKIYLIIEHLPNLENYNLKNQLIRACTSISLNIAEGSTYATNPEQKRFTRIAIHSLVEVVAIIKIIQRRQYINSGTLIPETEEQCTRLFKMLIAYDRSIR